jgi:hypothetical protein
VQSWSTCCRASAPSRADTHREACSVPSINNRLFGYDGQYFTGGSTAIDGTDNHDLERSWRLGGTLALPLSRNYSLKLFGSAGVSARTGNNYGLVGILVQYRWGAGL